MENEIYHEETHTHTRTYICICCSHLWSSHTRVDISPGIKVSEKSPSRETWAKDGSRTTFITVFIGQRNLTKPINANFVMSNSSRRRPENKARTHLSVLVRRSYLQLQPFLHFPCVIVIHILVL